MMSLPLLIVFLTATTDAAMANPFQEDTPDVKCKLEVVDNSGSYAIEKHYIAICSALDLTRVPDNLPNTTVELYLDQNRITVVPSFAFSYMPRLRVLDLSGSNVSTLSTNCFAGLNQLEELYLPFNNIVNTSQISSGVFASLTQLRILHVQGVGNMGSGMWYVNSSYSTWSEEIEKLTSLEELAISYFNDVVFPSELASLPNLTNLHLSFGESHNITLESLDTLRGGKIQELSFKANKFLHCIEHGSFDDMPELHLLNFACCYNLGLDHIIDVLSNVSNTQVTHLIVDSTNKDRLGDVIYGKADVLECRSVWHHLTHLSMQDCGLRFIHAKAVRCFTNLTVFSYGYSQVPLPYPYYEGLKVLIELGEHVLPKSAFQSVRFSYLLRDASVKYKYDWGCFGRYRRRPHTDYFPPLIESVRDSSNFYHNPDAAGEFKRGEATTDENESEKSNNASVQCHNISFLPRNLKYVAVDNIGYPGRKEYFCGRLSYNNGRIVNLSDNPIGPYLNGVVYGLDKLKVLDVSRSGYRNINPHAMEHLPSLTYLYASGNSLRQDSFTNIAKLRTLQHLDISDNGIPRLNRRAFLGMSELRTINLAKNRINSTDFLIDLIPVAKWIDVSGNQIRWLNERIRDAIDDRCSNADCGLEINLLGNPLSCNCQDLPFIKWIRTTRANLTKAEMLTCTGQDGHIKTIESIDISGMGNYCNIMAHLPLIASFSATVAIAVLVAAPLAYRFRWHLKWYLYRLKYLGRKHRYAARSEPGLRDAFVIYAFEDTDDRRWVIDTLRIKLEQENNYSLWLEGRNDIPGRFRVDNLMDMLRRSHTAIWILSRAFLQDIMCLEMAHQAFIRLGHRKNLVMSRPDVADGVAEELASRDMGQILEVLHPRYGIGVAEYASGNIHSETLFWETIGGFLDRNVVHEGEMIPLHDLEQEPEGDLYE